MYLCFVFFPLKENQSYVNLSLSKFDSFLVHVYFIRALE